MKTFVLLMVSFLILGCASTPKNADREPAGVVQKCFEVFKSFLGPHYKAPVGQKFALNTSSSSLQVGIDPWTLSPTKSLHELEPQRLRALESNPDWAAQSIEVDSWGRILDGHHRMELARRQGKSVDIVVRQDIGLKLQQKFFDESFDLYAGSTLVLNRVELAHFRELHAQGLLPRANWAINRSQNLDFAMYSKLPAESQKILKRFLYHFTHEKFIDWWRKFPDELSKSLFALVVERYSREFDKKPWLSKYLRSWNDFDSLPRHQKYDWIAEVDKFIELDTASAQWRNAYYMKLPLLRRSPRSNRVSVQVGDRLYEGRLSGDRLILEVPSEQVRHAAWNPLDTQKLIEIAKNPFLKPSRYPVHLELDGRFTLQDRNHRFAVFKGKTSKVELSYYQEVDGQIYLKTGNVRALLDDWGHGEQKAEELISLMRGERSPYDFIPENSRSRLIWSADELVQPE